MRTRIHTPAHEHTHVCARAHKHTIRTYMHIYPTSLYRIAMPCTPSTRATHRSPSVTLSQMPLGTLLRTSVVSSPQFLIHPQLKIQTSIIYIYTQKRTHKHGSTRQSSICFMFVFQSHQLHTQGVLQDGDGVNTVESIPSRAPVGRVRL